MTEKRRYWVGVVAMIYLGMSFMVAGVSKVIDGSSSPQPFAFPVFLPEILIDGIYSGLPWIEIIVGGLLITGIAVKLATYLSAFLIICFMTSNIYSIYLGNWGVCGGCFGFMGGLTVTGALILDVIMAVMVAVIVICYRGNFHNIHSWFLSGKKGAESV